MELIGLILLPAVTGLGSIIAGIAAWRHLRSDDRRERTQTRRDEREQAARRETVAREDAARRDALINQLLGDMLGYPARPGYAAVPGFMERLWSMERASERTERTMREVADLANATASKVAHEFPTNGVPARSVLDKLGGEVRKLDRRIGRVERHLRMGGGGEGA